MWKVFDAKSWSALLSSLSRTKQTADGSASAVSGLEEDFVKLTQTTNAAIQETNQNVAQMQNALDQLREDIENGTVTVKPVFPVVNADPASPKEGEAWIRT